MAIGLWDVRLEEDELSQLIRTKKTHHRSKVGKNWVKTCCRSTDQDVIDDLWHIQQHPHSNRPSQRDAHHMSTTVGPILTDQISHAPTRIFQTQGTNVCTVAMFWQIGSQTVIVRETLELWLPHRTTQSQPVQEDDASCINWSCLMDIKRHALSPFLFLKRTVRSS